MAKIRLTDYLRKKKKKEEILFESDEDILRRARERMEADQFIVSPAYRIENYRQAEKLVMQISDDSEARDLREQFRLGQQDAEREKKAWDLQMAHRHYEEALTEDEFRKVQKEFSALGEYEDAAQFCEQARNAGDVCRRKTSVKRRMRLAACGILALAVFFLFSSGMLGYMAAKMEGMAGVYVSARNRFRKLGDFLDAKEQAEYYNEKYLKQREQEEKTSMESAQVGDTVDFGEYSWIVLGKDETQLLLILKTIEEDSVFGPHAYGERQGSALWADSGLRTYLNTEAIDTFADAEQNALVTMTHAPADNVKYQTDGGPATEDRIRIPDIEEAVRYMEEKLFSGPEADVWLSSPGHGDGTSSFLTKSGQLMEYGNDVADDSLSVFAMICVDYSKLGQ